MGSKVVGGSLVMGGVREMGFWGLDRVLAGDLDGLWLLGCFKGEFGGDNCCCGGCCCSCVEKDS